MQIWTYWQESLQSLLDILSTNLGLGSGLAIIALTLALRLALLPVSWTFAYRACVQQKKVRKLQPEIQALRERFRDQPQRLAAATFELYRHRGLRMLDLRPMFGAILQMPVLLGMFQLLRQGLVQGRFLWVSSLSRPDFLLALMAGATTALIAFANPDLPEQARMLLILLPSIVAFVFALKFASALALYWIASNCFAAAQTSAIHYVICRRIRAGDLAL